MKVLQINALFGDKSTGSIVRDIHFALKQALYESKVASMYFSSKSEDFIWIGNTFDQKMHGLLTRITGKQGFYSKRATKNLLKKLEDNLPDIIHLHNIHSNFLNLPLLFTYAQKRNIPIVLTLHDCWYFTGKCYHFLDIGCDKWREECQQCPKRRADIPSLLSDNSQKVFQAKKRLYNIDNLYVVGCSKWIIECAKASPLFAKAQFFQIYNGADSTVFNPSVQNIREEIGVGNSFTIVTMANKWFNQQNANVCKVVLRWIEDTSSKLIIVGCTEDQKNIYKNSEYIISLGYVKEKTFLARIYNTANVFLNLTLVDTLPTVNIEAALCGTPIVTYDSGGSGELVLDGKTGYIVQPLNEVQIIEALTGVANGIIKREDCAAWALLNFEKERNYKKYLELYEMIYANKKILQRGI